jgi:anti-sigma regulatory factor (Ser/Thr protein kinase)
MFGFPRLKETMAGGPGGQELIDLVLSELDAFTGPDAEQEDDITMVTLQRSADAAETVADLTVTGRVLAEFDLASAPSGEREAMERVGAAVASLGLESGQVERLKTAVAEATMNAMEHGNEYRADLPVSIRVLHTSDRLRVQVTDHGEPVEAGENERETPDLEAKLEGRQRPRGWGLFLIEAMVDETRVTTEDGGHTLELVLRLEGGGDDDA